MQPRFSQLIKDNDDLRVEYEERIAVRMYEGGLSELAAKRGAKDDIQNTILYKRVYGKTFPPKQCTMFGR